LVGWAIKTMKEGLKKTGLNCKTCGYELLAARDFIFCPNCKKRIKPTVLNILKINS